MARRAAPGQAPASGAEWRHRPWGGTMTIETVLWTVLGLIALVGGVLLLSALWSLVKAKD
ncbi:hypothetical protein GCM10009857_18170 [Agromyces soli]